VLQSRSDVANVGSISAARHMLQVVGYVVLVFVLSFLINHLAKVIVLCVWSHNTLNKRCRVLLTLSDG